MNDIKDIVKKSDISSVGNQCAIFLCRRLERITMAIYMVTDLFPEREPLKGHLRTKCVELMSYIMSLTNNSVSLNDESFFRITSRMSEIDSSLRIALAANLISEMNYSVLSQEYKKFLGIVKEGKNEGVGRRVLLSEEFFKGNESNQCVLDDFIIQESLKGQVKGHNAINDYQKDIISVKDKQQKRALTARKLVAGKEDKIKRRNMIIKVVKSKKEVTVKDISKTVKDCSEKTLQRELIALVKNGVLKKEGERRWSRYSLK